MKFLTVIILAVLICNVCAANTKDRRRYRTTTVEPEYSDEDDDDEEEEEEKGGGMIPIINALSEIMFGPTTTAKPIPKDIAKREEELYNHCFLYYCEPVVCTPLNWCKYVRQHSSQLDAKEPGEPSDYNIKPE